MHTAFFLLKLASVNLIRGVIQAQPPVFPKKQKSKSTLKIILSPNRRHQIGDDGYPAGNKASRSPFGDEGACHHSGNNHLL